MRRLQVADTLESSGEHRVEIFLHCAEGSRIEQRDGGVEVFRDGQHLRVTWPELKGAASEVRRGSLDPIGGWVSRRFDRKEPAPTLVWSATVAGTRILRTFIELP
jgi:hypothetical protein